MKTPIKTVNDVQGASLSGLIQAYLMLSHLYYQRYESVVEDNVYDAICKRLLDKFDDLDTQHPHYHLIDREALSAGTAYHIKNYPTIVLMAADRWLRSIDDPEESRNRRFKK